MCEASHTQTAVHTAGTCRSPKHPTHTICWRLHTALTTTCSKSNERLVQQLPTWLCFYKTLFPRLQVHQKYFLCQLSKWRITRLHQGFVLIKELIFVCMNTDVSLMEVQFCILPPRWQGDRWEMQTLTLEPSLSADSRLRWVKRHWSGEVRREEAEDVGALHMLAVTAGIKWAVPSQPHLACWLSDAWQRPLAAA